MVGKKSDLGPIGENVTRTVRKFREAKKLGYAELSRRLAELGREIPPLGLRRIESGDRKVDVDDLVALAVALGVSPLSLLLPLEESPVVPHGLSHSAEDIWNWARGGFPLASGPVEFDGDFLAYMQAANPFTDFTELVEKIKSGLTRDDGGQ